MLRVGTENGCLHCQSPEYRQPRIVPQRPAFDAYRSSSTSDVSLIGPCLAHHHRKTAANMATADFEWAHLCASLRDVDVAGTVVTHQQDIVVEVYGVEFC